MSKASKKITLFIMSSKGHEVLADILNSGHAPVIDKVICSRDMAVQNDYYEKIDSLCKENKIPFFNRNDEYTLESDYQIAISWRWIIKNASQLIVLHDSILPFYRGFAPLPSALINGEKEVGVTALYANDDYDTGDTIAIEKIVIDYPIKVAHAIKMVSGCYTKLVDGILNDIVGGKKIVAVPQNLNGGSYCLWLDEDDYEIDWQKDSATIKRFVDSVGYPYRGASSLVDGRKVRILDAEVVDDVAIENRVPGKVIFCKNGLPTVVCGKGLIVLKEAKFDDGDDFLPLKKFRTRFI